MNQQHVELYSLAHFGDGGANKRHHNSNQGVLTVLLVSLAIHVESDPGRFSYCFRLKLWFGLYRG